MNKRRKKMRAAAKTTNVIRHVAATKWTGKRQRKFDDRRLGKFGPASPVRNIDPATGEVSEANPLHKTPSSGR